MHMVGHVIRMGWRVAFFFSVALHAVTVGSDTAVTRFNSLVTLNDGDIVAGFAALQGGFFLNSSTTTATWNCFFPVSTTAVFNGGSLYLQRDLRFADVCVFTSMGSIIGNNYAMDFSPSNTTVIIGCFQQSVTSTSIGVAATTETVSWSFDEQYVSVGGSALPTDQIETYAFNGSSLTFMSAFSGIGVVDSLAWHPSAYFVAVGSFSATGNSSTARIYSVNPVTAVFTQTSSSNVGNGIFNSVRWHPTGSYVAAATSRANRQVMLFPVSNGNLGTVLNLSIGNTAFSCDWAVTGTYLAVGFAAAETNQLKIYSLGAGPTLTLNIQVPVGFDVFSMNWNPIYTDVLAIGLNNTGAGNQVIVFRYNGVANTLTQITTISGLTGAITGVDWTLDGGCLLVVNGSTTVGANKLNVYAYDNIAGTLTLLNGFNPNNAVANQTSAFYSPIHNYIALSVQPTTTTSSLSIYSPAQAGCVTFSNLTLSLGNDFVLRNCCLIFSGTCVVTGNSNNIFSLASTATIAVAANSSLSFKNVTLQGLRTNGLQMLDSTSNLTLDNADIQLDSSYSFTQGSLTVKKYGEISGPKSLFVYSSAQPFSIQSKSQFFLDNLVTFSYAPASSSNKLLQFVDATSQLFLNGATLAVTTTGLQLTKGTLIVDRHAFIASDATVAAQAVSWGDGISSANDMAVQFHPDAVLEVTKGIVVNNNV